MTSPGPLDDLLRPPPSVAAAADPALLAALARAAAALARLDEALAGPHPLLPALLHRARLDAARRQAAADGHVVDPWHLAALAEGLRPRRLRDSRSIAEAGAGFEAGRAALAHHAWLTAPGFDEEGEVQAALSALRAGAAATAVPLLDAAHGAWRWLDGGGARPPLHAALARHWLATGTLRAAPLPLTGAAALRPDLDWRPDRWVPVFLRALADEADAVRDLLIGLEHGWLTARRGVAGRRRHSRTPAAVDLLAAAPLASATTLARALGVSVKSACAILDGLLRDGIAVEVTGRSARRLFGLRGLAPLADAVAPPYRPVLGRGRGRPRQEAPPAAEEAPPAPPLAPLRPVERATFDYADLEAAMAAVDVTIRGARRTLDRLARGGATNELDVTGRYPDEWRGDAGADEYDA